MQISYKIKIICSVSILVVVQLWSFSYAQLKIIDKPRKYYQLAEADSTQKMIELKLLMPTLVYDLRYATSQNFTGHKLYNQGKETFLRLAPARALSKVQEELNAKGYGLKIFDAYRPFAVTKKMWDLIHDDRYVADPSKGSGHNRGLAVDLTIISLKDGTELNMGTGFDNFTDSAHHAFKNYPDEVLANRKLLKETMEKAGFRQLETEWWHYSWPNDRNYDVLNIDFKKFRS